MQFSIIIVLFIIYLQSGFSFILQDCEKYISIKRRTKDIGKLFTKWSLTCQIPLLTMAMKCTISLPLFQKAKYCLLYSKPRCNNRQVRFVFSFMLLRFFIFYLFVERPRCGLSFDLQLDSQKKGLHEHIGNNLFR